jgi:hypothetical protein
VRTLLLAVLLLGACSPAPRTADAFAADPAAARAAVAACEAGERRNACAAARAGLAETQRRERIAAYRRAF